MRERSGSATARTLSWRPTCSIDVITVTPFARQLAVLGVLIDVAEEVHPVTDSAGACVFLDPVTPPAVAHDAQLGVGHDGQQPGEDVDRELDPLVRH